MAYWENKDNLLASLALTYFLGSNPLTSAANFALYSDASKYVIGANPIFCSLMLLQNSSTEFPIGVMAPIPVTTTLLKFFIVCHLYIPIPPSTCSVWPVIYVDLSDAKNATASAISSTSPILFKGTWLKMPSFTSSGRISVISVRM